MIACAAPFHPVEVMQAAIGTGGSIGAVVYAVLWVRDWWRARG